ncbi:MAG: hypothetical protein Q8K86_10720 [Candidatus Nanopelagicaceae bacterium]|nr:hypothetical protein [Candidatus Nanopelagicaceae bacterium]
MEGYWLNAASGKSAEIHEHAQWLLMLGNPKRLGISPKTFVGLSPTRDRVEILMRAMTAGLIRVRSHGDYIAFEFLVDTGLAAHAAAAFLKREQLAGPLTTILLNNLKTKKSVELPYGEWLKRKESDGLPEGKLAFRYPKRLIEAIEKRLEDL